MWGLNVQNGREVVVVGVLVEIETVALVMVGLL